MKIYHEELSDVQRYLNNTKDEGLEKKEADLRRHHASRAAL